MLTQTAALFVDAYRELNAKKMFWVVLALSLFVVAAFATVGINARGITVLWFEFPGIYNTQFIPVATFYNLIFSELAVGWWLNVFGILLALVSTAGIIPDFIAGGSIDLYLSKPISRLRLFLTKYLTGLLFVTLQVTVFTATCFVLIGIRAGNWEPKLLLAVPVTVLVFSYLFAVCTLLGVLTRSTVASLLLTVLFWLAIFGVHLTETSMLAAKIAGRIEADAYRSNFASMDRQIAALKERVGANDPAAAPELQAAEQRRRELEQKKHASDPGRANFAMAHAMFYGAKTLLPKTGETSALLPRWLNVSEENRADDERLDRRDRRRATRATAMGGNGGGWLSGFRDRTEVRLDDSEVLREMADVIHGRPVSWVIGTSLAFEAAILALASWIFVRRDY